MNSAFRSAARMTLANQRRMMSSKTPEVSTTFLAMRKQPGHFSKNWLSDPSTYPLLACMGAAVGLVGGVSAYFLTCCNDVQINTTKRRSIIRTWGN
ncbi:expressed unknown protein [Seminavis robusta]|uniref:Uncharacterized protein n=1 Tax=Seminavis robusta TaxID=568900 RepID=A0A9N8HIY6_9STRA|nr:expressed unknown protein [Seminavis robusta]|eukprot:Sro729_g193830.1 n/a (96) ;mRNA; r:23857-24287